MKHQHPRLDSELLELAALILCMRYQPGFFSPLQVCNYLCLKKTKKHLSTESFLSTCRRWLFSIIGKQNKTKKKLIENWRKDIGEVGSERCHEHNVTVWLWDNPGWKGPRLQALQGHLLLWQALMEVTQPPGATRPSVFGENPPHTSPLSHSPGFASTPHARLRTAWLCPLCYVSINIRGEWCTCSECTQVCRCRHTHWKNTYRLCGMKCSREQPRKAPSWQRDCVLTEGRQPAGFPRWFLSIFHPKSLQKYDLLWAISWPSVRRKITNICLKKKGMCFK